MNSQLLSGLTAVALDLRIAVLAFAVSGAAVLAPPPLFAQESEECGPAGPAEGCGECFEIEDFEPCGCCSDSEGNPTCLYCRVD